MLCSMAVIPLLPVYEAIIVGMTLLSSSALFSPGFQKEVAKHSDFMCYCSDILLRVDDR